MARLISNPDVREINAALLHLEHMVKRGSVPQNTPSVRGSDLGGGVTILAGGSSVKDSSVLMLARNTDGTLKTDEDGFAILEDTMI